MRRMALAACIAVVSTAATAQMMGGAISTSQYFPLVDGARYDYMYTSGPWSSATSVMHAGQTWAGVSGLTATHTTYTCNPTVTCAPDATDFYRMDPDGMHYFGGTGSNPSGTQYSMMAYTSPEWLLKNPVTPGTMMSGGMYQGMENWQTSVMGTGSMMGAQGFMSNYQALALETVSTPTGAFQNALHVREQRGSGYTREVWYAPGVGMVKMMDATSVAVLTGYTIPSALAQPGLPAPLAFTPVSGMWWNPSESGTGYNIQVQHGVLVATMFSYTSDGDPIWYLIVGNMVNAGAGVAASATLDKYGDGQSSSGMYQMPVAMGDDGAVTITFTSPSAGAIHLPKGRVAPIQPMAW